jgi:hypothetical protein
VLPAYFNIARSFGVSRRHAQRSRPTSSGRHTSGSLRSTRPSSFSSIIKPQKATARQLREGADGPSSKQVRSGKPGSVIPNGSGAPPFIQADRCQSALSTYPYCWCGGRAARIPPEDGRQYCLVFQPTGFTPESHYYETACALTARFHPYPRLGRGGIAFCGTFRILPVGRTPAVSRRGALRCPDFPLVVTEVPPAVEWTYLRGENIGAAHKVAR